MTSIRHTVSFALPFPAGSDEEHAFLSAARRLAAIDGVRGFSVLRGLDRDADFPLMLSMEFDDQAAYDAYNAHPAHRMFVDQVWSATVVAFREADFGVEPDSQGATLG